MDPQHIASLLYSFQKTNVSFQFTNWVKTHLWNNCVLHFSLYVFHLIFHLSIRIFWWPFSYLFLCHFHLIKALRRGFIVFWRRWCLCLQILSIFLYLLFHQRMITWLFLESNVSILDCLNQRPNDIREVKCQIHLLCFHYNMIVWIH